MNTSVRSNSLAVIPLAHGELQVSNDPDGQLVALRPACEQIGIDYPSQYTKLKSRHWATVVFNTTVGADGKQREMVMVTRDTFTMWLATLEPSRVKDAATREKIVAFQKEAVAALDAYFHKGGAINPRATDEQRARLRQEIAVGQMNVLTLAKGIVDDAYLEVQGRFVIAQVLGKEPELDEDTLPLDVESYLREVGVSGAVRKKCRAGFGKRLKAAYVARYGTEPNKVPRTVNGTIQNVNGYTREHLPLFDQVRDTMGLGQLEIAGAN